MDDKIFYLLQQRTPGIGEKIAMEAQTFPFDDVFLGHLSQPPCNPNTDKEYSGHRKMRANARKTNMVHVQPKGHKEDRNKK